MQTVSSPNDSIFLKLYCTHILHQLVTGPGYWLLVTGPNGPGAFKLWQRKCSGNSLNSVLMHGGYPLFNLLSFEEIHGNKH